MKEYILFFIVLLCFIYLTKQYYKQINDESIALLKNEPIDIDAYFYSDDYIKHWLPVLQDVPSKSIHRWYQDYTKYPDVHYPKPIVDYVKQKELVLDMYHSLFH